MRTQDRGSVSATWRHYLPGVLSYRLVWAVLRTKVKSQGKSVRNWFYELMHEPYDDGKSFTDMMNDGLQGMPVSFTDPHRQGVVFWRNGHLVIRTKNGIEHFDANCPQERDARIYARKAEAWA